MAIKRQFNHQLLNDTCVQHNITLTKDYTNDKITKLTVIEGHCINWEICNNTFSKLFVMFVENAKCTDCNNKYSYSSLITYCKNNNIVLLKDYSNTKITQYSNIEGNCINYNICKGSFSKQFMVILKNPKCNDCTNGNKYSYNTLISFCEKNDIILLKDYSNIKLTKTSTIEAHCINYDVCKGIINKNLSSLLENPKCHDCVTNNKHCYGSLISYCKENKITLLEDYSNVKLDKLSVIKANCINFNTCGKTFEKTFGRLLINPHCSYCGTPSEHNYSALKDFCDKNELTLLNDYSKQEVRHNTIIEGYCPNYDNCGNTFSKLFVSLKNNMYCSDCTTKVKYNYETLLKICNENKITLLKDYSKEDITANTHISAQCVNYNDCNNVFEKIFKVLLNYKNIISGYCAVCTNENKTNKTKETCLKKYGVDHVFKVKEVIDKKEKTNIEKYGFKSPLQNKEVIQKRYDTNLEKYGCANPMQNEEILNKVKETNLKNYGFTCCALNSGVTEKREKTNLEKYGVVQYFSSSDSKEKNKITCMEKYGVEYAMQDPSISQKSFKNSYLTKKYTFPSGNIIDIQGYENYGLDILINKEKINEEDIITKRIDVPKLWYYSKEKNHRHFVDIYIKSQNRCVEVKSTWTFKKNKEEVLLKQKSAQNLGYKYDIWVFDEKGELVETY
jgi:hypothetical protein